MIYDLKGHAPSGTITTYTAGFLNTGPTSRLKHATSKTEREFKSDADELADANRQKDALLS